jgi:hypothetical protein
MNIMLSSQWLGLKVHMLFKLEVVANHGYDCVWGLLGLDVVAVAQLENVHQVLSVFVALCYS